MLDKEKLSSYVKSIGGSEVMAQRTQQLLGWVKRFSPEDIEDVVITEFMKEDATRTYDAIWFFSNSFVMEAKRPLVVYVW